MLNFFRLLGIGGTAGFVVSLALGLLLIGAKMDARHWHKMADQNAAARDLAINQRDALKAQLEAISLERDTQRVVTRDRIVNHTRIVRKGEEEARKVEQAKPAGECKTPTAVMETDI